MEQFRYKAIKEQILNNEEAIKGLESVIGLIAKSTQRNPLVIQIERNEAALTPLGLTALRAAIMCKVIEHEQDIKELKKMLI